MWIHFDTIFDIAATSFNIFVFGQNVFLSHTPQFEFIEIKLFSGFVFEEKKKSKNFGIFLNINLFFETFGGNRELFPKLKKSFFAKRKIS